MAKSVREKKKKIRGEKNLFHKSNAKKSLTFFLAGHFYVDSYYIYIYNLHTHLDIERKKKLGTEFRTA